MFEVQLTHTHTHTRTDAHTNAHRHTHTPHLIYLNKVMLLIFSFYLYYSKYYKINSRRKQYLLFSAHTL